MPFSSSYNTEPTISWQQENGISLMPMQQVKQKPSLSLSTLSSLASLLKTFEAV